MVPSSPYTSVARVMDGFSNCAREGISPNTPTLIRVMNRTTTKNPIKSIFQKSFTDRAIYGYLGIGIRQPGNTVCKNHALNYIKLPGGTKVFLIFLKGGPPFSRVGHLFKILPRVSHL